jgi:hypothetical protein
LAGYLIDFDVADAPGTLYPDTFRHEGPVKQYRHDDAKAGKERQFNHDWHALRALLREYNEVRIDSICDENAEQAAITLEAIESLSLGRVAEEVEVEGTGSPEKGVQHQVASLEGAEPMAINEAEEEG